MARLLHVKFDNYRFAGKTIYASTTPFVPSNLVQYLSAILGLNNEPLPVPNLITQPTKSTSKQASR